MKTVELFAGIGGFRLAADSAGLATVWANDNDPLAAEVYRSAFASEGKAVLVEGSIHEHAESVPRHDILTAGFPCQPFSFAGKKQGLSDSRATTFGAIVSVLERRRPLGFVLENVSSLLTIQRGLQFAEVLRQLTSVGYSVEWKVENAADYGLAQNRRRLILVGYRGRRPIPVMGSRKAWDGALHGQDCALIDDHMGSFFEWGIASEGIFSERRPVRASVKRSHCIRDILEEEVSSEFDFTESTRERIARSTRIDSFIDGVHVLWNQEGGRRMGYSVYGIDGLAPTLTATTSRHYERFRIGRRYRRLTPVEYARLQGFPDTHCSGVARADQYRLLGNAVPPPVARFGIKSALKRISLGAS